MEASSLKFRGGNLPLVNRFLAPELEEAIPLVNRFLAPELEEANAYRASALSVIQHSSRPYTKLAGHIYQKRRGHGYRCRPSLDPSRLLLTVLPLLVVKPAPSPIVL